MKLVNKKITRGHGLSAEDVHYMGCWLSCSLSCIDIVGWNPLAVHMAELMFSE
jgi:hypothetical protein